MAEKQHERDVNNMKIEEVMFILFSNRMEDSIMTPIILILVVSAISIFFLLS